MKILIIEDNPLVAQRLVSSLKRSHTVEVASSGDEGLRLIDANPFDMLLLDLGLPDAHGSEICKRVRDTNKDIPILIVTGDNTTNNKVNLLDIGADDYLTKPFNADELRARVQALSRRRIRGEQQTILTVGPLELDLSKRSVFRDGRSIQLRRKEFDILAYLMQNEGRVMTRELIVHHAWPSTSSGWPGSVDVHIKQLRDKVDKPFAVALIKTAYGIGYSIKAA